MLVREKVVSNCLYLCHLARARERDDERKKTEWRGIEPKTKHKHRPNEGLRPTNRPKPPHLLEQLWP